MTRKTTIRVQKGRLQLLEAARQVLSTEGFAGLSTRRVAEVAKTQMSQIGYYFGSKEGMVLAIFEHMNAELVRRQRLAFENPDLGISEKWQTACDYLDEDLNSGYVRALQELIATGWTSPPIRDAVRAALEEWHQLLMGLAREATASIGPDAPFSHESLATLIAAVFLGAEALLLLGYEDRAHPVRLGLRQVGELLALLDVKHRKE